MLRRLEAFDARALRGIARSPVHLTRESNQALRKRLGICSPLEALQRLLRGRVRRSTDAGGRAWFVQQLQRLDAASPSEEVETAGFRGVPCPDCGQYFLNHRHMRSHRSRKHPKLEVNPHGPKTRGASGSGVVSAALYTQYALDGMPTCRFCKRVCTRVEGLKKHIRQGCPNQSSIEKPTQEETAKVSGVQVAPEPGESSRSQTPPAVSGGAATSALFVQPTFLSSLRADWRSVVRNSETCHTLRTYCVFCSQWIDWARLMHPEHWCHAESAQARVRSLGFQAASPCLYCGKDCKDARKHLLSCTPIFQAALALEALLSEDGRRGADGGGSACSGGEERGGPCFRTPPGRGGEGEGDRGGQTSQVAQAGGRRKKASSRAAGAAGAAIARSGSGSQTLAPTRPLRSCYRWQLGFSSGTKTNLHD